MKVIFTFENGTSRVTLNPEGPRDKALLSLLYPAGEKVEAHVSAPGDSGAIQIQTSAAVAKTSISIEPALVGVREVVNGD